MYVCKCPNKKYVHRRIFKKYIIFKLLSYTVANDILLKSELYAYVCK